MSPKNPLLISFILTAFTLHGQTWIETDHYTSPFAVGNITDLSFSNNKSIAGSHYSNHAAICEKDGAGNWSSIKITESNPPDHFSSPLFGYSTAIYGNTALVGSPGNGFVQGTAYPGFDMGAVFVYERDNSGNWIQIQKLIQREDWWGTNYTYFGGQVAIHDKTIAVGGDWTYTGVTPGHSRNDGSVYVFELDSNGVWVKKQELKSPDRANGDLFSSSIAIHGNIMVIGAQNEDEDVAGANTLSEAGSAYIFEKNAFGMWEFRQKITASQREASAHFARNVAAYNNTIVIGANGEAPYGVSSGGAAYVFTKGTNGLWIQKQKLVASDLGYWEFFGTDVAISEKVIAVGAHAEDHDEVGINGVNAAGAVYLFIKNTAGDWVEHKKICASNRAANKAFGISLAIDGSTIAVQDSEYKSIFLLNEADLENQSITFGELASKKIGDSQSTLTATATSGLPVIFSSSDPKIASVNVNKVTILAVGSVMITARQPGNNAFDPAEPVSHTLLIEKKTQQITFATIPEKLVTDDDFYISASSNRGLPIVFSSSDPGVATVATDGKVSILADGLTQINAFNNGNDMYEATSVTHDLVVHKLFQTITMDELSPRTFGDNSFELVATSSSGLPVTFTSDKAFLVHIDGNVVTVRGAGSVNITAIQKGNDLYDSAVQERVLQIARASQTIQFELITEVNQDEESIELSAETSSGLPVNYVSSDPLVASIENNTLAIKGIRATTIEAQQNGNENYLAAESVTRTLTVNLVLGVENGGERNSLKIYPNPSNGSFRIALSDKIQPGAIVKYLYTHRDTGASRDSRSRRRYLPDLCCTSRYIFNIG